MEEGGGRGLRGAGSAETPSSAPIQLIPGGTGGRAASRVCGPFFIRFLVNTAPKAPLDVKVGNYREAE